MAIECDMADLFLRVSGLSPTKLFELSVDNNHTKRALAAISVGAEKILARISERQSLIGLQFFDQNYSCSSLVLAVIAGRRNNVKKILSLGESYTVDSELHVLLVRLGAKHEKTSAVDCTSDPAIKILLMFRSIAEESDPERRKSKFQRLLEFFTGARRSPRVLHQYTTALEMLILELKHGETFSVPSAIIQEFLGLTEECIQKNRALAEKNRLKLESEISDFQSVETVPNSIFACLEIVNNPASTTARRAEVFLELGNRLLKEARLSTRFYLMASLYSETLTANHLVSELQTRYPEFIRQIPLYQSVLREIESCEARLKITELFLALNEIYLNLFKNKNRKSICRRAQETKQHNQQVDFLKLINIILDPERAFDDFINHMIHTDHQFRSKPAKLFKPLDEYHACRHKLFVAYCSTEDDMTHLRIAAKIFQQYFMAQLNVAGSFPQELCLRHEADVARLARVQHSLDIHFASA